MTSLSMALPALTTLLALLALTTLLLMEEWVLTHMMLLEMPGGSQIGGITEDKEEEGPAGEVEEDLVGEDLLKNT